MTPTKATYQRTKQHNRELVLKTIFDHEAICRADIARLTKLSRATVSDMVASLLEDNLGIAMGSSEAAGYMDMNGHIMGWLNELAFAPHRLQSQCARGRMVR